METRRKMTQRVPYLDIMAPSLEMRALGMTELLTFLGCCNKGLRITGFRHPNRVI